MLNTWTKHSLVWTLICDRTHAGSVPVWAPGDGGDEANVREEDGVVFDAIQGVVHLTQRLPVELKLELHLTGERTEEC